MSADDDPLSQVLARERIRHERELREMAITYERKLADARDHEMASLAAQHQIAHEREHEFNQEAIRTATMAMKAELDALRGAVDRLESVSATFLSLDRFDREHRPVLAAQEEAKTSLTTLLAQLGTLRGIIVFLGLPGVVALLWAIIGAASGHPVSGPGGIVP